MSIERIRQFFSHPFKSLDYRFTRLIEIIRECFYYYYYGKNIILMESHCPFDGNSGALYFYMQKQKKFRRYTYVWIIKGFKDGSFNNSRRVMVYSIENESKEKRWLINHARFSFYDDVPIQAKGKLARTIYLTHGCPPIKNVKGIINVPEYVDYSITSSEFTAQIASEQYSFPKSRFIITGQPRNDVLFDSVQNIQFFYEFGKYKKVIIWLPTFRKSKYEERNDTLKELPYGVPLITSKNDWEKINKDFNHLGVLLVIKTHPVQDVSELQSIINTNYSNIVIYTSDDLYKSKICVNQLFAYSDALISDYSSVVFDYLLTNKPIAYSQDDIDEYKLGLINDYEKITPGYRINSISDLVAFAKDLINNRDPYYKERIKVKNCIHKYQDGGFSKRIVELFDV